MAIRRIFVANRGEIALRIIRAARELGIATVQAVSAADRAMLPARVADAVAEIGPAHAGKSYLNKEAVLRAAIESGPIAATRQAAPASDAPATVASATPSGSTAALPEAVVKALGGTGNIAAASHHAGRWRIVMVDPTRAGEVPLDRVRATVRVANDTIHVLTD